ncbi:MAG: acpP 1 [Bryobacterales bacterium]|nr:acpP 1 [Bryobacterales bacterium]
MDRQTLRQRMNAIFQDIFDDPSLQVSDDMTAADVEGWDSLSHINLIVAVEKAFKIKLTTAEVRSLNNVGDFISLVERKAA